MGVNQHSHLTAMEQMSKALEVVTAIATIEVRFSPDAVWEEDLAENMGPLFPMNFWPSGKRIYFNGIEWSFHGI